MSHETLYTPALKALAERPAWTPFVATHIGKARNRACGDSSTIFLLVEGDRVVKVGHKTRACSICKASANLLCKLVTELVGDPEISPPPIWLSRCARLFENEFNSALRGLKASPQPFAIPWGWIDRFSEVFSGVREYPDRTVCVSLPILALRDIEEVK